MRINLIPPNSNFKFIRFILLLLVFGICAYAFSWNFKNRMEQLNSIFIDDKYAKLSKEEISILNDIRLSFKEQIGIGIDILIEDNKNQPLLVPSLKSSEIFIGVNVARNEAVLITPMLVKKVVGEGNRVLLEDELAACLQNNTAFQCISQISHSIFAIITDQ